MRQLMRLGLVVAAAGLIVGLTAVPSQAAATNYVALGDSYSSGTGTREYFDSDCQKSNYAYPALVAKAQGYNLDFEACSGAVVDDIRKNQEGGLNGDTGLVTISVGGNDAGFSSVITKCAEPWVSCNGEIDTAQTFIKNELPGRLDAVYGDISSKAPNAKVIVVGYPRLFNGEDCNAGTFFSPDEEKRLNETADLLASTVSGVASNHGFSFADVRGPFTGHAVCDDPEWLNGLSNPIGESYHPNRDGHAQGYAPAVTGLL
ncbi:MAG TPA: SGNH/GDSL hydrolase family protein [Stackebrandtia sp.]|jgi:lysophospholipase L1-like esterase|uniref:SGNH/GDSL hydrolase family protein n=1 Tax=Stackebrandtia sp. TaxID=2023065 RepID=UPI002D6ECBC2|nr:SGNH/GDSL hydrolase family protein [Stackebrandtia sp.]HZE39968.1 SGNH/GDSL hydrolase family protein [Stackebrandtia sp.]